MSVKQHFTIPIAAIWKDFVAIFVLLAAIVVVIGYASGFNNVRLVLVKIQLNPTVIIMSVTLVAVVIGILIQRQTAREKNTLDFEEKYKHNKDIIENFKLTVKVCIDNRAAELIDNSDKDYHAVTEILNEWERAANAIHHKLYDENMLYDVYGTTVIRLWQGLGPFITARQQQQPRFYLNFVRLAVKWQLRRAKEEKITEQLKKELPKVRNASDKLTIVSKKQDENTIEKTKQKLQWQMNDLELRKKELEKLIK